MRPRYIILLVGHRQDELAVRRYLLGVRGYCVLTAATVREALDAVIRHDVRVAIVDMELEEGDGVKLGVSLVDTLSGLDRDLRTILVSLTARPESFAHLADAVLCDGPDLNAELIERCRVMCRRKRGPRKAIVDGKGEIACAS